MGHKEKSMMKKALTFLVVTLFTILVLTALVVFAPAAKAQGRAFDRSSFGTAMNRTMNLGSADELALLGRRYCENHRGTGDQMEASWCYGQVYGNDGRYEGYNPLSVLGQRRTEMRQWANGYNDYAVPRGFNGYDRRYDRRGLSHRDRNTIIGIAAGGAALYAINEFVIQPRREKKREEKREALAESRHQEVLAALRAREAQVDGETALEEDAQEAAEEIPQASTPARAPRTVFQKNGLICNNTGEEVVIVVNGTDFRDLKPGKALRVSDLPKGKVEWRFAR